MQRILKDTIRPFNDSHSTKCYQGAPYVYGVSLSKPKLKLASQMQQEHLIDHL